MRLTLRTLLAYLDDTLEPAQAKQIGQKVAESDTAQELIARIKQVTRRRRLTTPPETGPNKIDANTIAEYLDNTLDADQLADIEQICLASDVHLAEIASCHQILTLVLGEPVLVPPTAKQRMYGVVKGREAIPFRKPPSPSSAEVEVPPVEGKEVDETLRLGLPALRSKEGWRNPLILLGGAAALVACLVIAIIQLLPSAPPDESARTRKNGNLVASADKKRAEADRRDQGAAAKAEKLPAPGDQQAVADRSEKGDKGKTDAAKADGAKADEGKKTDGAKADGAAKADAAAKTDEGKKTDGGRQDKVVQPKTTNEVPIAPPSDKVVEVAEFKAPKQGAPLIPVLLQLVADKTGKEEWRRLERPRPLRVVTGRPLVSLPAYRSVVVTDSGVRLTLDGTIPEYFPGTPLLFESLVELHQHNALDLDLTLRRGRIRLGNTHSDRPVRVRVRFENTTNPESKETWDITLDDKETEVLIDCFGFFPPDERFHENPKSRDRTGPVTQVGLTVLSGSIHLRMDNVAHAMKAPPGPARMVWNSEKGPRGPLPVRQLEEWTQPDPPIPKGVPKEMEALRGEMQRQAHQLSLDLFGPPELGIIKALGSAEPARRKLAVRACGALDMLPRMADALTDKDRPDVRQSAIETLMHWIASARDNEYLLFDALKQRYTAVEAEKIVTLLHGPPGKGRFQPQTYEMLIDMLASPRLVLRDLASWQLFQIVPRARELRLDPTAPPERMQAQWRKLVPRGTIPAEYQKIQKQGFQ